MQLETLEKDKENANLICEKNKAGKKYLKKLITVNSESATTVTYKENRPACNEKYVDPPTEDWMCCKFFLNLYFSFVF